MLETKNGTDRAGQLDKTEIENLSKLEAAIERNLGSFVEAGNALSEIRDSKLYREIDGTFEAYCARRWNFTRQYAIGLIGAVEVVARINEPDPAENVNHGLQNDPVPSLPANERQAREVAKVPPEQQKRVWKKAVATAPKDKKTGKPKVTAAHIRKVVEAEAEPAKEPEVPRDELGTPLPNRKELREAFAAIPTFTDLMGRLVRIKSDVKHLPESAKAYLHVQPFEAEINNARIEIKHAKPFAVCPYCKTAKPKCEACKGMGWVNEDIYDRAPSEMKVGAK